MLHETRVSQSIVNFGDVSAFDFMYMYQFSSLSRATPAEVIFPVKIMGRDSIPYTYHLVTSWHGFSSNIAQQTKGCVTSLCTYLAPTLLMLSSFSRRSSCPHRRSTSSTPCQSKNSGRQKNTEKKNKKQHAAPATFQIRGLLQDLTNSKRVHKFD